MAPETDAEVAARRAKIEAFKKAYLEALEDSKGWKGGQFLEVFYPLLSSEASPPGKSHHRTTALHNFSHLSCC